MKKSVKTYLKITSFILFSLVCIWIYFFKCNIGKDLFFLYFQRRVHWNPFFEFVKKDGSIAPGGFFLAFFNILGFVLYGFLASSLFSKKQFLKGFICSICFSLFIELLQYSLAFGGLALGDLIFNSIGGLIGALIFVKVNKKFSPLVFNTFYLIVSIICIGCIITGIYFTIQKWPEYTYFL